MVTDIRKGIQDDLLVFLQGLDQYGFSVDVRQLNTAQYLILSLIEQDRLPDDLLSMATILAPIFSVNLPQQQSFYYLFEQWCSEKAAIERQENNITSQLQKAKKENQTRESKTTNNKQADSSSFYKTLLTGLMILMFGAVFILAFHQPLKQWCIELKWCDSLNYLIDDDKVEIVPQPKTYLQPGTLLRADTFKISSTQIIPTDNYVRLLIGLLPLFILLIWLFWVLYRRNLYLEQQSTTISPELQYLSIPPAQRHLYQQKDIRRSFQRMRQHRLVPGKNLDVDKTVEETIGSGDFSITYFQQRKILPEYLLLLDRNSAKGQQLSLFDTMVKAMENEGLPLVRYYFHGDPRLCFCPGKTDQWLNLSELAERFRDYRLVIISDAERFFHPVSGLPAAWVADEFQAWQSMALLTPKEFRSWGLKELSLHRQGFLISPSSRSGVELMSRHLAGEVTVVNEMDSGLYVGVRSTDFLPQEIRKAPHRWLESSPPSPEALSRLLQELKDYLGDYGYLWLSTCAVYPSLHWDLTANLGLSLAKLKGRPLPNEDEFLHLLRLPWFNHGFMPEYLRETFIAGLDKADSRLVRQLIGELLEKGELEKNIKARLPIAKVGTKDWWLRLCALYKRADKNSPLRDYVFMRFLIGRRLRLTHFKLPLFLRRFLMKFMSGVLGLEVGLGSVASIFLCWFLWDYSSVLLQQTVMVEELVETPEMIVIPAGSFRMGDLQGTGAESEIPIHQVTFTKPFAMSTKEITFREYDYFAKATGRVLPNDRTWGRGNRPVIHVSWEDANAYAQWLSEKTGKPYRLPSEAEWEYAARAGTETDYPWGELASHEFANYGKDTCCDGHVEGRDQWEYTAPVGQFEVNGFGLYDMHGNVWEWVADCWNGSYEGAPNDGSAWMSGDCDSAVLRGGSWDGDPVHLRSSYRFRSYRTLRYNFHTGFRLVQDLFIREEFRDDLKDGGKGPVMVTIPPGRFQMGNIRDTGYGDEKPVHPVVISQTFAIGKTEVTFDDYDRFAQATGRDLPDDEGWGRGSKPVTNVSWEDAKAYATWLSEQTSKNYRLPTEAEWEYAARAGTKTDYFWGNDIDCSRAQYSGGEASDCYYKRSDGSYRGTATVGSFGANVFGLHDMHGNVWEWVEDCWNKSYEGAPNDGSAWMSGDCGKAVLRGGSWYINPEGLRSSNRFRGGRTNRYSDAGFRLVQD